MPRTPYTYDREAEELYQNSSQHEQTWEYKRKAYEFNKNVREGMGVNDRLIQEQMERDRKRGKKI